MCLQRGAICTCVCDSTGMTWANHRLDAASMVLLEKLNKLEATSFLEPSFPHNSKLRSPFSPTQPRMYSEVFQVPKGRWSSLDYFMSLPFVGTLLPPTRKYESLVFDNTEIRNDCKLPNLHR